MNFNNPTPVQVGMTGTFSGVTYRVLGRVVLGVIDDGTAYYWNEYNLQADGGEATTLVYEVTDNGPEWRLFTMFDPQFPITAADAATKRIGDPLNLDGTDVRVTLRDSSRVYHIEGQAPEGVDMGDRAEYFNAEAGKTMIVVSWTGDEVECYHGVTISASLVEQAFNIRLPQRPLSNFALSGTTPSSSGFLLKLIVPLVIFALFFWLAMGASFSAIHIRPRGMTRVSAPSAKLTVGSSGKLGGKNYTVISDALVELNEVSVVFQRHEFHLRDEDGNGALLIRGWKPGVKDWCLLTLDEPNPPMTPQQAAAIHIGQTVPATDSAATVNELFRSIALQVNTADILQSATGHVFYGFSGSNGSSLLLGRWDESVVNFYKGDILPNDPTAVFVPPVEK